MRYRIKVLVMAMVFLLLLSINYVSCNEERDSDLDGIYDSIDRYPFDYDNDGMPDIWEKKGGLRYDVSNANEDPDNDGIKNVDEYKQGTDPLVSEKTKERVELEMLTPVEITMARGLIWVGVLLLLLIIVMFILYRAHIFRVFKFLHHVSKEHFEEHLKKEHLKKRKVTMPYMAPIYRRKQVLPYRYATTYPRAFFVQGQIRKEFPKMPIKEFTKPKQYQEGIKEEKPPTFIQPEEYQKAYPKRDLFGELAKKKDVFERLSEQINEHKKVEKIKSN